jgi:cytochrome c-type biogenesis protein CcmF
LIGTLYPLALETITGEKISVGAPYFNLTFGPIMLPLLLLVPIGALLSWKRADLFAVLQRLWWRQLGDRMGVLVLIFTQRGPWLAPSAWPSAPRFAFMDPANRIALFPGPSAQAFPPRFAPKSHDVTGPSAITGITRPPCGRWNILWQ